MHTILNPACIPSTDAPARRIQRTRPGGDPLGGDGAPGLAASRPVESAPVVNQAEQLGRDDKRTGDLGCRGEMAYELRYRATRQGRSLDSGGLARSQALIAPTGGRDEKGRAGGGDCERHRVCVVSYSDFCGRLLYSIGLN